LDVAHFVTPGIILAHFVATSVLDIITNLKRLNIYGPPRADSFFKKDEAKRHPQFFNFQFSAYAEPAA
jgi:hypothetical protein